MKDNLLSARGARRFLRECWQKAPKVVHGMLPEIETSIDRSRLIGLACRDDVESRIVIRTRGTWEVRHGPFRRRDFAQLPPRNWTLLVNGVENFVPAARALQMRFGFVPYARHDDVMISYAAPGGGVGPHYDSYDVFLLQGTGARRWQVSNQSDLALVDGAPLKILRRFRPDRTWILRGGDVLYLPPNFAHHGVALEESITWSIGMRAPTGQEMSSRFMDFLQDRLTLTDNYRDPGLKPQRHPSVISAAMLRKIRAMVNAIRWSDADVARCLGEYLTEPPPHIVFQRARRLQPAQLARVLSASGLRLSLKSRMLLLGHMVFINGESVAQDDAAARSTLRQLADERRLPPGRRTNAALRKLFCQWYEAGYIEAGDSVSV